MEIGRGDGGSIGLMTNGKGWTNPNRVNQRPEVEFEELLHATGIKYAFIDLKRPAKGGEWLQKRFTARPIGNIALEGQSHKALNGFFYIKKMFPGTNAP